jgi:putative tricarboxylic transport membrane protein
MRRIDLLAPPMVLGVILGPMIEENLRRAIIIDSNLLLFFTRPISIGIIIFSIIIIFGPAIRNKFFAKKVPHQQSIN